MTEQTWQRTTEGRHLTRRRNSDTRPELALRRALHAQGARFRLGRSLERGCNPDIVLVRRRLAIWVDGCFWHGCPQHGRRVPWSGPNASLWEQKMDRNRQRDAKAVAVAESLGWRAVRLWECRILDDPEGVAASLLRD